MAAEILIFGGLAILIAVGLLRFFPEGTRRALRFINASRALVFGIIWVSTALVFVSSGAWLLVVAGLLMLVLVFVQVFIDDLHIKAREAIGL